ncbi:anti-sigma factor antagonist [Aeromicrobium sp. NPDC092404]|uniref:anti-sigma factor antagonist n=1 Tax=Aeromicrobium sp. NPDC092404 TaxID=3154976 RepID=UPI0034461778
MSSEKSEMFAQMAFALHQEKVPEATVHLVVDYARSAIRCDEAGVLVTRRNKVETAAATSMLVRRADQFQQSLREGPSLWGRDEPAHVVIDDTLADDRWPRWAERVALLGLRSVLSLPLHTAERTYGALNLYSREPGAFTAGDVAVAATFARHASIALASGEEVFHLKIAADSRNLLGQAQGILMERFDIDSDRAFDVLRRHSQSHNVKLAVIAQQVVDQRQLPTSAPPPPAPTPSDAPAEPERPPMTLTSVDDGPHRIIGVAGEVDVSTAPEFIETALAAVESGQHHLIVDLHRTSFIDSSGLSAFILVQKALAKQGGTLDLVGLVERVHRLFTMAGLDQVIRLHATLDQAKESLDPR